MLARFQKLLQAPSYADPDQNVQARNINAILQFTFVLTFLFLLYGILSFIASQIVIAVVAIIFEIGILMLLRAGHLRLVSTLFVSLLWGIIFYEQVSSYGGVRDSGFASFALPIAVACMTIGIWGGIGFAVLTALGGVVLINIESAGLLPPRIQGTASDALISYSITFVAVLALLYLAIRNYSATSKKATEDEKQIRELNAKLEKNYTELEERTALLELRSAAMQTVSDVVRLTSQLKTEDELAERLTTLLAERIRVDHVGLFLTDEKGEFAYLRASNSPEGRALMEEQFRLHVVSGDLGYIFAEPDSLQYQAGSSIYYVGRPFSLPDTKTNFTYPLISGMRFIGLLNIQTISPTPQFLDQQAMQSFANQIALAISNAQLLNQMQGRLQEINRLAGNTIRGAWEQLQAGGELGYHYDRIQVQQAGEKFPAEVITQLLAGQSATYVSGGNIPRAKLVAPIILRESVIGVIGYEDNDPSHIWQDDEKLLLQTVASRVSLSLENTRLFTEAQQRAERERTLGQIAGRMRETLEIDTMLQTAVREMKRSLGLKQAEVRLQLAAPKRAPQKRAARDKGAGA